MLDAGLKGQGLSTLHWAVWGPENFLGKVEETIVHQSMRQVKVRLLSICLVWLGCVYEELGTVQNKFLCLSLYVSEVY